MNLATIARDLCVLTDWYTERPEGLTFRELGERYGMSESGAHQVVSGARGKSASLLWPTECSRLIALKKRFMDAFPPEGWPDDAPEMVRNVLAERPAWTSTMMDFADDRRELRKLRASE